MSAKILLWDLETSPAISYTWGRWKQNIGGHAIVREGYILCWAARFLDEDEVHYDALPYHKEDYKNDPTSDLSICETLLDLMEQADILVAHNGDKFDLRWLNAQLAKHELPPVHPQKTIDTLKYAKQHFRFPSNRLDELADYLGIEQRKIKTDFTLWEGCMEGDKQSWEDMVAYNIQDLEPLAEVYLRLRPYIKNHPNLAIYEEGEVVQRCPKCLSTNLVNNGYYRTNASIFQRRKCQDCGNQGIRDSVNLMTKEARQSLQRIGL